MKRVGILVACAVLLSPGVAAKPLASRQVLMTNGVSLVFDADSKQNTIYGYVLPITIARADAGKMLEIVAESPRPIVIELFDGEVLRTETEWFSKHPFLGTSGRTPTKTPSLKWMAEPGTVSALFITTMPPGEKPERFTIAYGKELRRATPVDKAEWQKAVEAYNAAQAKAESERRALFQPFTAMDTTGARFSTTQYRGRIVLIDFWAAWCPPCRTEMPVVVEAYRQYHARGFEVIGVSLDKSADEMQGLLTETGAPWRQVYDGKGWESDLAVRYGIQSIPASFLLDANGRIIARDLRGEALGRAVSRALAGVSASQPAVIPADDKAGA